MAGRKHLVARRQPTFSDFPGREPRKDGDKFVARRIELRGIGEERRRRFDEKQERERQEFIQVARSEEREEREFIHALMQ